MLQNHVIKLIVADRAVTLNRPRVFAGACCMLALLGSSVAFAVNKSATVDEQTLLKLENDWAEAENRHDIAALSAILDDRFVATIGTGKALKKDAFIAAMTAGAVDPTQTQTLSDSTVVIAGDTAVVVQTDTAHVTHNGLPSVVMARITVTYTRINKRWRAPAEHAAFMPPT